MTRLHNYNFAVNTRHSTTRQTDLYKTLYLVKQKLLSVTCPTRSIIKVILRSSSEMEEKLNLRPILFSMSLAGFFCSCNGKQWYFVNISVCVVVFTWHRWGPCEWWESWTCPSLSVTSPPPCGPSLCSQDWTGAVAGTWGPPPHSRGTPPLEGWNSEMENFTTAVSHINIIFLSFLSPTFSPSQICLP